MSLLLDALKRAEQEKLARRDSGSQAPRTGTPAPEPAAARPQARPTLQLEPAPSAPPERPAPGSDLDGARAVFAARQAEPAGPASRGSIAILAMSMGAVVIFVAGGAYVWREMQPVQVPVARAPLPARLPALPASAPTVAPAVAPTAAPTAAPATSAEPAGTQASPARVATAVVPAAEPRPAPVSRGPAAPPAPPAPQPMSAGQLAAAVLAQSGEAGPAAPLRLSRSVEAPRVAPEVRQGYEALLRGDDDGARRLYEAAVAADETSPDAHLGLATAAARTGDRETAARHYRRALALDPGDASAIAGLAVLASTGRADGVEERIRADLTRHPRSAALHFALGNLYASQERWTEAQAAYFEAHRLDAGNAELAYNLAVSLDHLGQARLAADFYERALASARQQSVKFDRDRVAKRIAQIRP